MEEEKGAYISDCENYRYRLWRIWDDDKPKVMFVMLNPSNADGEKGDNTISGCIKFAKKWGYGGIYVGNLFAYRTTYPDELFKMEKRVGPENIHHIKQMAKQSEIIICAWGHKQGEPPSWLKKVGHLYYLKKNKDGSPGHPSRLSRKLEPIPYTDN